MTEQEIEKKLEKFKSGLELFKAKLDDARETIGARDAQIEDIEKDIDVLQKMNNEKAKEIEKLTKKLEEAEDESKEIASMYNDKNDYLAKQKNEIEEKNKEIEKLKNEMAELEEAAEINKQVEALDQLRDEVQKAKNNSDELYNENGRLKAQIASMELSYQELDLAKAGLEDKNKLLAEESLSHKTDIQKERDKLAKKISSYEKENKELKSLLEDQKAKYAELQVEYDSLKIGYEKYKSQASEKKTSNIISIQEKELENNKELKHYILGTTSESVMNKFIEVIKCIYKGARTDGKRYQLLPFKEAVKLTNINESDISIISSRLLSLKNITGEQIFIEKNDELYSILSQDDLIKWISTIKE